MSTGDINYYIKEHPDVDKDVLILGIALGIEFLHSDNLFFHLCIRHLHLPDSHIVHGDIKGVSFRLYPHLSPSAMN